MKRILLGNGYAVDIESNNLILKNNIRKYTDDEGVEREASNVIGHYGNFKSAMDRMLREKTVDGLEEEASIKEMVDIYKKTLKDNEKLFEHFKM